MKPCPSRGVAYLSTGHCIPLWDIPNIRHYHLLFKDQGHSPPIIGDEPYYTVINKSFSEYLQYTRLR